MRGERAQKHLAVIFKQNTNRRGLVCGKVNQTCAGLELGTPRYFGVEYGPIRGRP